MRPKSTSLAGSHRSVLPHSVYRGRNLKSGFRFSAAARICRLQSKYRIDCAIDVVDVQVFDRT